jgi:hypothetical protein
MTGDGTTKTKNIRPEQSLFMKTKLILVATAI